MFVFACLNQKQLFQNDINVTQSCFVATNIGTLLLHEYDTDTFYWPLLGAMFDFEKLSLQS